MPEKLRDLPGLGIKTEQALKEVGIESPADLMALGAIPTFLRLAEKQSKRPSLNFLYALVGAIEGRSWLSVVQQDRYSLLMELEGYQELEAWLSEAEKEPKL